MLSLAQRQALKTYIGTVPTAETMRLAGDTFSLLAWCNANHATAKAWRPTPWGDVANAIDWATYTPATANVQTDTAGTNRLLTILIKLMVQQNMILSMGSADSRDSGTMAGLLDTVKQVLSGAGGAQVNPGGAAGVNVATVCTRPSTNAEQAFIASSPTQGNVTAQLFTIEDLQVSSEDVNWLVNN